MAGVPPPADFKSVRLKIHTVAAGGRFGRIHLGRYPDPLGFGKTRSRFSDARRRVEANRFGVLYLGETFTVCFLEAVLRDRRDGVVGGIEIEESELEARRYAEVEVASPLRLVDLRGNAPSAMGVPSEVHRGIRQQLGRAWSTAFHEHPAAPDGIVYPSRLNGETNLAVYGRAVGKLRSTRSHRLLDVPALGRVLSEFKVALITPDP